MKREQRDIVADVSYVDGTPALVIIDWNTQTRFAYKGKDIEDERTFLRLADAINCVPIVQTDRKPLTWEICHTSFLAGAVAAALVISVLERVMG